MTVQLTMTPPEQQEALAQSHTIPHKVHHEYRSGCSCQYLPDLVAILAQVGIEPTDAAAFEQLRDLWLPEPLAPEGRRLDMEPEDYQQRMLDLGIYSLMNAENAPSMHHLAAEQQQLTAELKASMRVEADDYIDLLRPVFTSALDSYTPALEAGLSAASTADSVLQLGDETIQTYLALREGQQGRAARALDAIVGIRARISTTLQVGSSFWVNSETDGAPISYGAGVQAGPAFEQYQGWARWLEVARTGSARLLSTDEPLRN